MSSDKPSTSDIIEELTSIRAYLDEDDNLEADIPVLTTRAEPVDFPTDDAEASTTLEETASGIAREEKDIPDEPDTPSSAMLDESDEAQYALETRADITQDTGEEDTGLNEIKTAYEIAFAPTAEQDAPSVSETTFDLERDADNEAAATAIALVDDDHHDDAIDTQPDAVITPQPEETECNQHATQAPLFEKNSEPESAPKAAVAPTQKEKRVARPEVKARGENPFLPPHIRKQLGKHKFATPQDESHWQATQDKTPMSAPSKQETPSPQTKVEIQGDLLEGFAALSSPAESQENDINATEEREIDAAIEEVISTALPKLEAQLRQALKNRILKPR